VDEITCRELVELVTAYLEHALDDPTLNLVEEHLVMCGWCATYVDQMRATTRALATLPPEPVPEALQRAVAAALRAREEGGD
jgi:predicted anti-sigma-YlaC factor YlaD